MDLALPKGMNDSLPEEQILYNRITRVLTAVFEIFGFEPLETPAIEMFEILASKYAGGEEILKEIYTFKDRGNRDLALRYDLTVPFARVYGMYKPPLAFKRYQIGKVWRDGPTGLGRYREFIQCDVDVVGTGSMLADAEIVGIVAEVFRRLAIPVTIKVNSIKLLHGMVMQAGIPEEMTTSAILALDKMAKIGSEGVAAELEQKGISTAAAQALLQAADLQGENEQILATLAATVSNDSGQEGVRELRAVYEYATAMGVDALAIDPSLARGLAYYTGTIFETVARDSAITSSIAGGGRYDNMVGDFLQDGKPYPAVGISFGLSRIFDVLREREAPQRSVVQVYVIPLKGQLTQALHLAAALRGAGISTDFEKSERSLKASMKYVNTRQIPYAVIIGADEAAAGVYRLRDMRSGDESLLTLEALIQQLHA